MEELENESSTDPTRKFPPPPYYYSLFHDVDSLKPPNLDEIPIPPTNVFSLPIIHPLHGVTPNFDESLDYCSLLKLELKSILSQSMEFLGLTDQSPQVRESACGILKQKIRKFYLLLSDYREHEARELLLLDWERKCNDAHSLQSELESLLQQLE